MAQPANEVAPAEDTSGTANPIFDRHLMPMPTGTSRPTSTTGIPPSSTPSSGGSPRSPGISTREEPLVQRSGSPTRTRAALGSHCRSTSSSSPRKTTAATTSIVDPHGDHLADAKFKLRALSDYAETYGNELLRIESVAKVGEDVLRTLDLQDPKVREAVRAFEGGKDHGRRVGRRPGLPLTLELSGRIRPGERRPRTPGDVHNGHARPAKKQSSAGTRSRPSGPGQVAFTHRIKAMATPLSTRVS